MPTSILLRLGGRTIVIDAGLGVTRAICDRGMPLTEIDLIFITHLHSDHYLELGPLIHTVFDRRAEPAGHDLRPAWPR